jgi:hypothetical protein
MALTGCLGAAFLAGRRWLEGPDLRSTFVFGFCGGFCVLAKFSSLLFFPAAAVPTLAVYLGSARLPRRTLRKAIWERLP